MLVSPLVNDVIDKVKISTKTTGLELQENVPNNVTHFGGFLDEQPTDSYPRGGSLPLFASSSGFYTLSWSKTSTLALLH